MPGAGYEIPISVSAAETMSIPQNLATPTYFVFAPTGSVGGDLSQQANPYQPATATSSAAVGGSAASATGAQSAGGLGGIGSGGSPAQGTINLPGGLSVTTTQAIYIGLGVLAALAAIWYIKHKK